MRNVHALSYRNAQDIPFALLLSFSLTLYHPISFTLYHTHILVHKYSFYTCTVYMYTSTTFAFMYLGFRSWFQRCYIIIIKQT